jgi:predicted nuclease of predicted toxin-antitoxin system
VKPRFLADADLNRAIVSGVKRRAPGIDFWTAQDASIDAMADLDVLAIAARDSRILVSHDFGTMPHHFRDFVARQRSPGVFLISQAVPVVIAVEALLMIAEASEAEEWENQLTYLPL